MHLLAKVNFLLAVFASTLLMACGGGGGTNSTNTKPTVTVALSQPKVNIGASVTLSWTSTNATSCKGLSGISAGALNINGTMLIIPTAAGQVNYTISCDGEGGGSVSSVLLITPIPVQSTSYLNAKNINIPSQKYPATSQLEHTANYSDYLGAGVAFADFFQEGKNSMVWFTNRTNYKQPAEPSPPGTIKFFKFDDNGNPIDYTSTVLNNLTGCISPRKLLVADFNGDGKPDIFAACHGAEWGAVWAGEHPRILLSQPDGKYKNVELNVNCYCHSATAADLNGDGFVDILTSDIRVQIPGSDVSTESTSMILLSNDGKGNFTTQRDYSSIEISMPSIVSYSPLVYSSVYINKTNAFTMELVDVNGDGNPDLIFGTTDDMFFPSRVYLNRNNRFNIVDAIIPINISNFWAIDIVVSNSNIYFYGLKNYNTTYDSINIYKYNFSTGAGSVIYNSNGRRWLNANIEIDWVWMFPYNGNLVPLSDLYTGVSIPM